MRMVYVWQEEKTVLVLRRSRGQSIIIENDSEVIVVKVLKNEKGIVSLGVNASQSVIVDRQEVYEKRQSSPALFRK